VDSIEFILEGEVHHGNRVLKAGEGVYRSAGTPYSFWAGPEGASIADFRAHTFYKTDYVDPPEKWPHLIVPVFRAQPTTPYPLANRISSAATSRVSIGMGASARSRFRACQQKPDSRR
jgi:hypothetical protein